MKVMKLFLAILLLILVIPLVSANIELNSFSSNLYNLGDKILLSGSVTYPINARTNLNLILNCGGSSSQVAAVLLNLEANQPESFSSLVNLPVNLLGDCKFVANLMDFNGTLLETSELPAFTLTNELKGAFEVGVSQYQLGDKINIRGTATKQNNELVDGVAVISFKQGGNILFLDTLEVTKGSIDYSKTLSSVPTGSYIVDISVSDNFGNRKIFTDLINFDLTGNLDVVPSLDKNLYSPGETFNLNGYVASQLSRQLSNLNLEFVFENQIVNRKLTTSSDTFSVPYSIFSKVKTGIHYVHITVNDEQGNYGSKTIEFNVRAIPTILTLDLNQSSIDPEQSLGVLVIILDQAGDPIQENVNVYLLDIDGDVVVSKVISTGNNDSLLLPKYAKPGAWKVRAEGLGLNAEAVFNVRKYKKLDASVNGTKLVLENVGNVPYVGALDIFGNEIKQIKNVDIDVKDTEEIKLDKMFSPGSYNVTLPALAEYFDDVLVPETKSFFSGFSGITGNAIGNANTSGRRWGLFLALIVLCCGAFYLILSRRKEGGSRKRVDFTKDKDFMRGQKKLDELRSKGIRKDPPREYGKATQADIDDWKKRVQQSFKEQEKKKSENEFVRHQQKNIKGDGPGLFNMFG